MAERMDPLIESSVTPIGSPSEFDGSASLGFTPDGSVKVRDSLATAAPPLDAGCEFGDF